MWFLILLSILNSGLNNRGFVLEYRITVAGLPLNLFDMLLGLGLLVTVIQAFVRRGSAAPVPVHRAFAALLGIFIVVLVLSSVIGFASSLLPRYVVTMARNWTAMALAMVMGYVLFTSPRSGVRLCRGYVAAGLVVSVAVLAFFKQQSEEYVGQEGVNSLRTVEYISNYAGLATALLVYSVLSGHRFMPRVMALPVAGFCLLGQCATLSRSEWLAAAAAIMSALLVLPREARASKLIAAVLVVPLLLGVLWLGVYTTSRITGHDFDAAMMDRVRSMLPNSDAFSTGPKAWDTRLPAIKRELELWAQSPVLGNGFGAQFGEWARGRWIRGFYHNVWTGAMAESGLLGLAGMLGAVLIPGVIGLRLLRDGGDVSFRLVGALGVISAAYFFVLASTTLSINTLRGALPLGIVCGAVLKARALQLGTPAAEAELPDCEDMPDGFSSPGFAMMLSCLLRKCRSIQRHVRGRAIRAAFRGTGNQVPA
jgi:hypothetical protein